MGQRLKTVDLPYLLNLLRMRGGGGDLRVNGKHNGPLLHELPRIYEILDGRVGDFIDSGYVGSIDAFGQISLYLLLLPVELALSNGTFGSPKELPFSPCS
jgi:hypothetical protein